MLLPAVTARFWTEDLSWMIAASMIAGVAASVTGLLVSYHSNVPTGPAIVLVSGVFYLLSMFAGPRGGLLWRLVPRKHLEA